MKHSSVYLLILLLVLLAACDGGRSREMTAVLDRAQQQNLDYDSITNVDSIALAAKFFDRHGTPNQQMRAYYLLGCAYRDMGEAPAALENYQNAVDRADTTSTDCDIKRLMSVYGQMATLFHYQNLPTDELDAYYRAQSCAEKLKDTLTYIRCIELKVRPYFLLHDTISMLRVLQQAQQLYVKHGYAEAAASVYPAIIDIYIARDSLEAANKLIDIFEAKSGLFDAKGNISAGRENYYELKGVYHINTHNYDSAEYYYRKLLGCNLMTGAYRGLFSVYKGRGNTDSIVKYAQLYEEAVNHEQEALRTQTVHQMSSLYNYQRFLKKADAESKRAARLKYYFLLSIFLVSVVIFVGILIGIIQAHKRKLLEKEAERLKKDYIEAVAKKEQLAVEMEMLKANHEQLRTSEQEAKGMIEVVNANNSKLLKAKEREIAELNEKIREYAGRLLHSSKNVGNRPQLALLIEDFHCKATRKRNTSLPHRKEWGQLVALFMQTQPEAYVAIGRDLTLSSQELKACILLLLKFTNGEIISLLDISSQGMTNIRARINEKLFGEPKASNLTQNLKKIPLV